MEAGYEYEPLDQPTQTIRLLAFDTNIEPNDTISIILQQVTLEDVRGSYFALSYTWGPPEPTHRILVNGRSLFVRDNLWRFLKHHSREISANKVEYLWTDAICINQEDIPEKNHQVAMMGRIYSYCRTVLVWLGANSEVSPLREDWSKFCEVNSAPSWDAFIEMIRTTPHIDSSENQRLCAQLALLCEDLYWHRLWIVQEVFLGPKAFIILGSELLKLESAYRLSYRYDGSTGGLISQKCGLRRVTEGIFGKSIDRSLARLLGRFFPQGCQDPRDKVYGLMSLVGSSASIKIDYSQSRETLFAQVLEHLQADYRSGNLASLVAPKTGGYMNHAIDVYGNSPADLTASCVGELLSSFQLNSTALLQHDHQGSDLKYTEQLFSFDIALEGTGHESVESQISHNLRFLQSSISGTNLPTSDRNPPKPIPRDHRELHCAWIDKTPYAIVLQRDTSTTSKPIGYGDICLRFGDLDIFLFRVLPNTLSKHLQQKFCRLESIPSNSASKDRVLATIQCSAIDIAMLAELDRSLAEEKADLIRLYPDYQRSGLSPRERATGRSDGQS